MPNPRNDNYPKGIKIVKNQWAYGIAYMRTPRRIRDTSDAGQCLNFNNLDLSAR